ncbi:hypothetical protein B0O80DRAFT_162810 [Mortierella sp. GBAus27b]|nr:hypothetical protein B0O80DRAFT_162810 [Mortierella sp. GBAus27b]
MLAKVIVQEAVGPLVDALKSRHQFFADIVNHIKKNVTRGGNSVPLGLEFIKVKIGRCQLPLTDEKCKEFLEKHLIVEDMLSCRSSSPTYFSLLSRPLLIRHSGGHDMYLCNCKFTATASTVTKLEGSKSGSTAMPSTVDCGRKSLASTITRWFINSKLHADTNRSIQGPCYPT